jgi:hypothetical protein
MSYYYELLNYSKWAIYKITRKQINAALETLTSENIFNFFDYWSVLCSLKFVILYTLEL